MNYQRYANQFWEDGYLVIEDFFDVDLMDTLNSIILEHYGMTPEWEHSDEFVKYSATEVVPWFPFREGNNVFEVIEKDGRLLNLTEAILGQDWKNLYFMAMFSKKGTKGQAWHQDSPPEDHQQFNLNRLFYPHDINDITGGKTVVVPRTHKGGAISIGDPHEDLPDQIVLSPTKGTLIFLHGHLWHRVQPIQGDYRVSANSRAIPNGTPEDITDIAVYRNIRYKFSTAEIIEKR